MRFWQVAEKVDDLYVTHPTSIRQWPLFCPSCSTIQQEKRTYNPSYYTLCDGNHLKNPLVTS